MEWKPVLQPNDYAMVQETIEGIRGVIASTLGDRDIAANPWLHDKVAGTSLAAGLPGIALFLAEHHRLKRDISSGRLAIDLLSRSLNSARSITLPIGFYRGISGIAWVHRVLVDLGLLEESAPNQKLAERIQSALESDDWSARFDLVDGLAGIGIYLSGTSIRETSLSILVRRLLDASTFIDGNRQWRTGAPAIVMEVRDKYPEGYSDLGLAHGQSGVISLLSRIQGNAADVASARVAIEQTFQWMRNRKFPVRLKGVYPRRVAIHSGKLEPCGIGWCNGDLSIAIAFISAGLRYGEAEWIEEGLDLATDCARTDIGLSGAIDPGLCHGTAGIGHVFNRLYQFDGRPLFRVAARQWLMRTLAFQQSETLLAGFQECYRALYKEESRAFYSIGFLNGLSGIGLALLSSIAVSPPHWDEALCLKFSEFQNSTSQ